LVPVKNFGENIMKKSGKLKILALSIGIVAAIPAQAYTISDPFLINPSGKPAGQDGYSVQLGEADAGSSFNLNWLLAEGTTGDTGATTPGDFSAEATFTLDTFDIASNLLQFSVSITNTTESAAGFSEAGISSLGFGVDPNATGGALVTSGSSFDGFSAVGSNLPAFSVDTCIWSANNCSGGSQNDLLAIGSTDSFVFQLLFSGLESGDFVTLDTFGLKTQTNVGSFELAGLPTPTPPPVTLPVGEVPEPSILALLGLGIIGMGFIGRRKKHI